MVAAPYSPGHLSSLWHRLATLIQFHWHFDPGEMDQSMPHPLLEKQFEVNHVHEMADDKVDAGWQETIHANTLADYAEVKLWPDRVLLS